ncbi:hypothetical protein VKT23_018357 [Stygiomarasmius scandens]|uniref:Histone deacetylase domain-containing protein n=1 Tax=Marasmiellus scandens TaxID=2682957 RepID=A0ABR1IPG4_9AGAR
MSSSPAVAYVVSQDLVKYSSRLPCNTGRSLLVHSLINALGLLSNTRSTRRIQVINPRRAAYKDLAIYHSKEYLDFVLNPSDEEPESFGLEDDCPIFDGMPEYIQLVAGATCTAANALKLGVVDTAICWDGGRHHAQKSRASGFCYVADCVLAILLLKKALPKTIDPPPSVLAYDDEESQNSAGETHVVLEPVLESSASPIAASSGLSDSKPQGSDSIDTQNANEETPPSTSGSVGVDSQERVEADATTQNPDSKPRNQIRTKPRVMYLDLDIHFGDGVAQAFYSPQSIGQSYTRSNRQVLTLSIHHASPGFFPSSSLSGLPPSKSTSDESLSSNTSFDPYTLSIPLLPGAGCSTYASIWLDVVERVREAFDPDYIVVQCGVDGLSGDGKVKIGNWSLGGRQRDVDEVVDRGESNNEHKCEESELELETGSLGWCISRIVNYWPGKKLFLGGGGYNHPNAARAWAFLTSIITGNPLPLSTPIPHTVFNKPNEPFRFFPAFAPSFTLDVPPGNMRDMNTEEYLMQVKGAFEGVYQVLEDGNRV